MQNAAMFLSTIRNLGIRFVLNVKRWRKPFKACPESVRILIWKNVIFPCATFSLCPHAISNSWASRHWYDERRVGTMGTYQFKPSNVWMGCVRWRRRAIAMTSWKSGRAIPRVGNSRRGGRMRKQNVKERREFVPDKTEGR